MITDINNPDYVQPEIDEEGNYIPSSNIPDAIEEVDTEDLSNEDIFYEASPLPSIPQDVEDDKVDKIQEASQLRSEIDDIKNQIIRIYGQMTESGERTQEQVVELEQLKALHTEKFNALNGLINYTKTKTLEERLTELTASMQSISVEGLLDILTEGGRKSWLYKDDENNILIDGTSIPELTILVQKLNLIASDGANEGEINLNPEFINMIVRGTGSGDAISTIKNMYYLSSTNTTLEEGEWIDTLPTPEEQQDKFLWIKTVTSYLDITKPPTETSPICISATDGQAYRVEIIPSNGNIFMNGVIHTELYAKVYKNEIEITDTLNASSFRWKKVNSDGTLDEAWNSKYFGGCKYVTITGVDVYNKASFYCEIDI